MKAYLLVFLGAGLGGALRYGAHIAAVRVWGMVFPWSTLGVNVLGSFLMGALAAFLAARVGEGWKEPARLFLATGILGGFTTFSAFSLEAVLLWERVELGLMAIYIAASTLLSILALAAGLALVRALVSSH